MTEPCPGCGRLVVGGGPCGACRFLLETITTAERVRQRQARIGALDGEHHQVEVINTDWKGRPTVRCPHCRSKNRSEIQVPLGGAIVCGRCGDLLRPAPPPAPSTGYRIAP